MTGVVNKRCEDCAGWVWLSIVSGVGRCTWRAARDDDQIAVLENGRSAVCEQFIDACTRRPLAYYQQRAEQEV